MTRTEVDDEEVGLRPGDELAGHVAIVTGAGRNIGRAIARSLAAGGASVMVNALTSVDAAAETVALIKSSGGKASHFIADVSDPTAVEAMVNATVEEFGSLSLLVNNHTYRHTTPIEELALEEWHKMISIALTGVFLTCHAAIPHIIDAGGGSIVNLSGQNAHVGYRGGASRAAAKCGVEGMSRSAALDLAGYNITVNCVSPGAIETERDERSSHGTISPVRTNGESRRGAGIPAGRQGVPGEIAAMVRMLCGPDARFITGQTIHVNGGALRR